MGKRLKPKTEAEEVAFRKRIAATWTPERRAEARQRNLGLVYSAKARKNMSKAKKGHEVSAETRAKISTSKLAFHARKKEDKMEEEKPITYEVTRYDTLGDSLPKEMARIRDVVIPAYESIGSGGKFAIAFMRRDLDLAAKALASGDLTKMIRVYQDLKGYKL